MIVADLTWPDVAFTAIPTVAGLGSAYIAYLVRRDVKTSNGTTIAQMVEDARDTVTENATMLSEVHGQIVNGG